MLAILFVLSGAPVASAQTPAYIFTKLVDTNDVIPGSNGVFFQPNAQPAFDGTSAVFWNGGNFAYNSIWSVRLGAAPVSLVDLTANAPGGTGLFTSFFIDFSAPGYLVARDGAVLFAARDSAPSGTYSGGLYSVATSGGTVTRVANHLSAIPGGTGTFTFGFRNFSLSGTRAVFDGGGTTAGDGGIYAADLSGANATAIAVGSHPIHPEFTFPVNNFSLPSISGSNVALYGGTVFDPSSGYNAFYTTPSSGGFLYGEPVTSSNALPGDPTVSFHTRLGAPRLDGTNLFFAADDSNTNPNYFGLYRVGSGGGTITRIVDRNSTLPGLTSISAFNNYASSGSLLAFTASAPDGANGVFVGDGTATAKVLATGDPGPFGDTATVTTAVELGAYAFVNGQMAIRAYTVGGVGGVYLAAPFSQSADLSVGLSAQPASPATGSTAILTVTLSNAGPSAATNTVLRLTLPAGLTFQSASGGGTFDSGSGAVIFPSTTLAIGANMTATVSVRVDLPGVLTASAYANATNADSNRRNNHAFLPLPAPAARPTNYTIRRIVDTQTPIPDRPGQTFGIAGGTDPLPAVDGGRVAFVAIDSSGGAVWTANADGSGGMARIASVLSDPVPGYPGETFTYFSNLRLRNGTVAFYGGNDPRHNGLYAAPAGGGAFRLIVNTSSARPDRSAPFDFVNSYASGLLGDGRLTFLAGGVYAYPVAGGTGAAVLPEGTVLPVRNSATPFFNGGAISGTRVAFFSGLNSVGSAFLDERRLETSATASVTVSPSDPLGGTFTNGFGSFGRVLVEGNTLVFRAVSGANGSIVGLYSITGTGAPVKLVDTLTPVPGGVGNFIGIDSVNGATSYSLNNGEVAFLAADANNNPTGIYSVSASGGPITKVVALGDSIGGSTTRVIQRFIQPPMEANALGQGQVAFRAEFFDSATNSGGSGYFVATPASRLVNISTRLRVETGDNVGIAGFVLQGSGSKRVIVRATGPSLANQGVSGVLANPFLTLLNASGQVLATNDSWKSTQQAEIQATGLAPLNDNECAIVMTLPQGAYTAIVNGVGATNGVALVEVYDLDFTVDNHAINIATRGIVRTGDNVMIAGIAIRGSVSKRVIVRAIGPDLTNRGVAGALADPFLTLLNDQGQVLATNDNWKATQQAEISATGFAPKQDAESAIVATLPPGNYTAIVSGVGATSGVGLVEAYELP